VVATRVLAEEAVVAVTPVAVAEEAASPVVEAVTDADAEPFRPINTFIKSNHG